MVGALIAAERRNTLTIDNDWSPTGPQSTDGDCMIWSLEPRSIAAPKDFPLSSDFMTCFLEPSGRRDRANLSAISATWNRHHIDLNRGPWNTTTPTNGT
jgi:hypothetical protein